MSEGGHCFIFPPFCISCVECDRINVMLGEADEAKDEVNNNTEIVRGKITSLNNVKNVCFFLRCFVLQ